MANPLSIAARRRADRVAVIIARLAAIALIALALMLVSCCSSSRQESTAFVYPPAPASIDLAKCQARRATWYVRPAYTFHGVTYSADSSRADSVVDVDRCMRGGR